MAIPWYYTCIIPAEQVIEGPPKQVRRQPSVGREVANVEVIVVNDEGGDVVPGEIGEVIGRGDHMMKGYWRMPEATQEALRDGYMHTGDLATVDQEGCSGRHNTVLPGMVTSLRRSENRVFCGSTA
ncbi:AMP-binding protein [Chloroflexota bacterium]